MNKIGPALVAGNTVVLKPAPTTPLTSLLFGEICAEVLPPGVINVIRSEEHTSELQSLMRISYAVFCLKKKTTTNQLGTTSAHIHTKLRNKRKRTIMQCKQQ